MSTWPRFADLQELSDDELIERHDALAATTVIGTGALLDELRRRDSQRVETAILGYTRIMMRLTWVIAGLTFMAVAATMYATLQAPQ